MVAMLILSTLFVLMAIGMPVAFALAISGTVGILASPGGEDLLNTVPQQVYSSLDSYTLMTIPLFIFAGTIMAEGGVAKTLIEAARYSLGRGRGGLSVVTVASTVMFSGVSGSSTADAAAIGKVMLPELNKNGYPAPFSAAVLAGSAATATLIPPTTDLIIIGVLTSTSIGGLFAAGLLPALVNSAALMLVVWLIARRRGYGGSSQQEPFTIGGFLGRSARALPAMLMLLIIVGGIVGGIFTPTEASAVAAVYGLLVAKFIYRRLTWESAKTAMSEAISLTGIVMLIIATGSILSYALTVNNIPDHLAQTLTSLTTNPFVFLFIVQVIFLAVGTIMDGVPALLILMPILAPISVEYGIEPIHFGILVAANLAIGLITPPIGLVLSTAAAVAKLPIERVVRPMLPLLAVLIAMLMLLTYVEDVSMLLPRLLGLDT
ncbi:hypothetical protein BVC93_14150 [Mycobacterium sp. MS1601]|uniref:TRAP transporter large permease n=1 Tax=Mycobacterium sp. MS1601 TaxID=1936029 RepID=UPI000979221A|nr:TRAP transporter large permease [Mycobacterium sp. MS1601]AQA03366.1 hypothetical protein BVC93_14150 [Mycobacterium sp. MS1601]